MMQAPARDTLRSLWRVPPIPALLWLGYVGLLIGVPVVFPPDASLPNVAARSGYNTNVAYLTVAVWTLVGLGYCAFVGRRQVPVEPGPRLDAASPQRWAWSECLVAAAAALVVYWPPFLARYAHYSEDSFFMSVLGRMDCGQRPYRDFEFLYGPLMIYPAHAWLTAVGFSMQNYYWCLAVLQGLLFAVVMRVSQAHLPDRRTRYLAFALLSALLFDSLLGLNYLGWRVMPVLLAIVVAAARPYALRASVMAGSLLGLQLNVSFDHGAVAVVAVTLMYAASVLERPRRDSLLAAAGLVGSCLVVGAGVFLALMGETSADSVGAIAEALRYAQTAGVGNFRFYWTLNSLCLFALLSLAVAIVGSGLPQMRRTTMCYGDRLWLGALLFAVGSLRVAMQRADIWHLTLPFVPLIAVCLWQPAVRVFTVPRHARTWLWVLILGAVLTRAIGLAPTASHFLRGWARGAVDVVSGAPAPTQAISARRHTVQAELSHPDPGTVELARFLASSEQRARPVIFYGDLWWLGLHTGVCPNGYSFFQLMYTDTHRPMTATLNEDEDTLVVMGETNFQRLYDAAPPRSTRYTVTAMQRLGSWLSSIHIDQQPLEAEITYEVWKRNLGDVLVDHYEQIGRFGSVVVLQRRSRN